LITGALVWVDVALTFALLYWELVPGWRPTIVDHLYLAFTNATAFSPTDVMPMRPWVKMLMAVQGMISLVLLSLVIANAVNILG